jgi:MOSC domain-containing protein YiiM
VEIDYCGVVGDRQATRYHHGRPWQALCLWSSEVIACFAADGHPVFPGAAGENITISGLPWADVRAGVRIRAGSVLCEVSAYALPCFQNKPYFRDGDFATMHHERGPVSRVYATVIEPGTVRTGDSAILEP